MPDTLFPLEVARKTANDVDVWLAWADVPAEVIYTHLFPLEFQIPIENGVGVADVLFTNAPIPKIRMMAGALPKL